MSHDVEIINPDHVIAHLSAGGKLAIELKVEKGRGYVPGNTRRLGDLNKSIGKLVLDASARCVVSATLLREVRVLNSVPISTS